MNGNGRLKIMLDYPNTLFHSERLFDG